ncbi:MAG TPA: urease accessory UreF family protein [Acidisphaera sp.]|nr:urease accessory UreF family protein [Acidisphaera sp.]
MIAAQLRLQAWLSPAFPIGAFAYSHGIEWAVEASAIHDARTLQDWIDDVLRHGAGRSDAILLRHAYAACADAGALDTLAELAVALSPARERRLETTAQGAAFARAAAPWHTLPALPYPIAVGALAGRSEIEPTLATACYLQAFAANLISAAVRLVPLGQSDGLRVLAALEATVLAIAHETRNATLDDLGGCAWLSDIAAMRHETQYTRLFRS